MKIGTRYHGEILVDESQLWLFESGIPGFQDEQEFIILPLEGNEYFNIMQSVKTEQLAFVITDPFIFFKDYDFTLEDGDIYHLKLEKKEDVKVFVILTVKEPLQLTTANLQGPVIFNQKNKMAKQVILKDTSYTTKHLIFQKKEAVKG